jgi:hypothetical protein
MSAELAGQAYVEMSVKGKEEFAKAFAEMQASVRNFATKLAGVKAAPNTSALNKFFKSAKKEFADLTKITMKYGSIAGAAIGGAAVVGMTKAISSASNLQETMNKFNVVFGDQAGTMQQWGESFAKQMGRSKQETLEFMANAQGLVIPMGIDPQQASQMSQTLAQLSFDLASFHNSTDIEAFDALRSALTGEAEPMKRFGVIVNETAVKAELLKKGLDPNTANEAQKAMARYNIILAGTTAAQGDVERSGNSWANRMKALQASVTDLAADIGQAFMPIAEALLGYFRELVISISGTEQSSNSLTNAFGGMGTASELAASAAGYIVKAFALVDTSFNMLMGTMRQLMLNLMGLFKLMINNPLARGVFGKESIDNLVSIVDEVSAATTKLQEENRKRVEAGFDTLMDPKAGEKAVADVQAFVADQKAKFDKQREQIMAAREAAKAETAKAAQDAADGVDKSQEAVQKQLEAGQRVALTNLEQLQDLRAGQPAEAGAPKPAKEKPVVDDAAQRAKEMDRQAALDAQQEAANKTVQLATPQALEATSTAAIEKFRENALNQQLVIQRQQAQLLQQVVKVLRDPKLLLTEFGV